MQCLQGKSFAGEFRGTDGGEGKAFAFSQWPYRVWPASKVGPYRMGYTVRTASGFRFTEYVPYDDTPGRNIGNWTEDASHPHDVELYDYNVDPWETANVAAHPAHADLVQQLKRVLRHQFA